jgi:hypothetical protein
MRFRVVGMLTTYRPSPDAASRSLPAGRSGPSAGRRSGKTGLGVHPALGPGASRQLGVVRVGDGSDDGQAEWYPVLTADRTARPSVVGLHTVTRPSSTHRQCPLT